MIISVDIFYDEEKLFSILSNLQTNLFDIDLQTNGLTYMGQVVDPYISIFLKNISDP